ncbi:hypothetical protein EG329_002862 [Mollisiaceae sp. DMI_Dod_QoI]|nr:hypothetical protein EG329_002862 [Helotiales sp. DMI_Dod_QoI]
MPTVYTSLDAARNEFRILQLRSIAFTVAPEVHPFKIAALDPTFLSTEAPIQCKLYTALQSDRPRYQALSYTWGDTISPTPIIVNGVKVLVTENLLAALKRIRENYSDIHLWVDALCINQLDNAEKAEQVKRMGDIYRNAAKTIIWLGPEYDDSHNTLFQLAEIGQSALKRGTLMQLLKLAPKGGDLNQLATEFEAQLSEIFLQHLQTLPLALKFLSGCASLFSRPYWSRVWIIQEFVVSPNVYLFCGRDEISYSVLHPACVALPLLRNFLLRSIWDPSQQPKSGHEIHFNELVKINIDSTTMYGLLGTRSIYQRGLDQPTSLFQAICSAQIPHKPKAKDDKDLIFALLGMASDVINIGVSPDYDTTCEEVYTSTARSMIYQGDVDVLSLAQHHSKELVRRLPSWVPDWRTQIYPPFGQTPTRSSFKVSGSAPFFLTIDHNRLPKHQVKLLGYLLSHVETLGTKTWCPPYGEMDETLRLNRQQYLRSITTLCQKSDEKLFHQSKLPDPYPHPNDRASAEMSTPVSGMELYGENLMLRHANNPLEDHADLTQGFRGAMKATQLENRGPYSKETSTYFFAMKLQKYRRGILLDNGLVGTGPNTVEIGDAVVIFKGAKFPYVMRRKEKGGLIHWITVGAAYIHGVMYGELFEKSFSPGLPLEEFLLID